MLIKQITDSDKRLTEYDHAAVEGLIHGCVGADHAAEKAMIKHVTGTDEAAYLCLSSS